MTDTKFTPGHWHVIEDDGVYPICIDGDFSIAEALGNDDANLIAAAPELYEALDMFVQAVENDTICVRPGDREIILTILEQGNAALAKARGEPNQTN